MPVERIREPRKRLNGVCSAVPDAARDAPWGFPAALARWSARAIIQPADEVLHSRVRLLVYGYGKCYNHPHK